MSEEGQPSEQLRERVKRSKDSSWSAPLETEGPPLFEAPDYKPLEPLEPSIVNALTEGLNPTQTPDLSEYFDQLSQQPEGEGLRMHRPPLKVSMEVCPEGRMGMCLSCADMPCSYVKQRVLRALLTEIAYGQVE